MPDNVSTIDHAFSSEIEAEKYLFTCYSYLPNHAWPEENIGLLGGDEIWLALPTHIPAAQWYNIAQNIVSADETPTNCWDGRAGGRPLFIAIRNCNIFLENVEDLSKVEDLTLDKRQRWIAEVKFLKAYYHFYLLRIYGPIPIVDKNLPVDVSPEEVKVKRAPMDECVNYIVNLLDECNKDLPLVINRPRDEMGRITQPINRAIKARLLLMAASPLFNGNPDFVNFKDKDGAQLFNPTYDETKWQKAVDAAKEAIETSESAGHKLFYFENSPFTLSETSLTQMSIRHSVCERINTESIWGLTGGLADGIQKICMPRLDAAMNENDTHGSLSPTLKIVKQYYTKNGVPIEEDKTLDFSNANELRAATHEERYNIKEGYKTARINFDRENRFYAHIGFDGGRWLMLYHPSRSDEDNYVLECKKGQVGAGSIDGKYSITGYFTKKLVNWDSGFGYGSAGIYHYAWPEIRLAEVYLMYAEALNEVQGPVEDVHKYLNLIRKRAGLKPIAESWENYSKNPSKPSTKDGMREIIHRERLIELSLEGSRYWDLKRWKKAVDELSMPILGWDISQSDAESYYQEKTLFNQKFIAPKDYFLPIRNYELTVNSNLVQNPGW